MSVVVVVISSWRVQIILCKVISFKKFFCELIGVRKLNMKFTLSVSCYLKRLEKTFSQFQDKNIIVK